MKKNIKILGTTFTNVDTLNAKEASSNTTIKFVETSDANATADDIMKDKTAYVNGVKIVGTGEGGGSSADLDALLQETF